MVEVCFGNILKFVSCSLAGSRVSVDGTHITEWTFGPNNTLSFTSINYSGWLQFVHLPGSPIIVGKITQFEGDTSASTKPTDPC